MGDAGRLRVQMYGLPGPRRAAPRPDWSERRTLPVVLHACASDWSGLLHPARDVQLAQSDWLLKMFACNLCFDALW